MPAREDQAVLERVFTVTTQQMLEEYELADLLLVPSECAAKSFSDAGAPEEKLFLLGAGVDTELFRNDTFSEVANAVFSRAPDARALLRCAESPEGRSYFARGVEKIIASSCAAYARWNRL